MYLCVSLLRKITCCTSPWQASRHVCWFMCLLVLIDLSTHTYLRESCFAPCVLVDLFTCADWFSEFYVFVRVTFEKFLLLHFSVTGHRWSVSIDLFICAHWFIDLFNCADWFIDLCWSTHWIMCICVSLSRRITCCTSPWKGVTPLTHWFGLNAFLSMCICVCYF